MLKLHPLGSIPPYPAPMPSIQVHHHCLSTPLIKPILINVIFQIQIIFITLGWIILSSFLPFIKSACHNYCIISAHISTNPVNPTNTNPFQPLSTSVPNPGTPSAEGWVAQLLRTHGGVKGSSAAPHENPGPSAASATATETDEDRRKS